MRTRSSSCESDDATSGIVLALQRVWSAADCLQLLCVFVVSVCVCVLFDRCVCFSFSFPLSILNSLVNKSRSFHGRRPGEGWRSSHNHLFRTVAGAEFSRATDNLSQSV